MPGISPRASDIINNHMKKSDDYGYGFGLADASPNDDNNTIEARDANDDNDNDHANDAIEDEQKGDNDNAEAALALLASFNDLPDCPDHTVSKRNIGGGDDDDDGNDEEPQQQPDAKEIEEIRRSLARPTSFHAANMAQIRADAQRQNIVDDKEYKDENVYSHLLEMPEPPNKPMDGSDVNPNENIDENTIEPMDPNAMENNNEDISKDMNG